MNLNTAKKISADGHESRPRDRVTYRAHKKTIRNCMAAVDRRDA